MTWFESPFQGWSAIEWESQRCRRADRAPGRGRAGACPSSRLGRTGRPVTCRSFLHGRRVPDPDIDPTGRDDLVAVGTEGDAIDPARVPADRQDLLAGLGIP